MGVSALSPALVAMVGGGVVAVGAAVWAWPSRRRAARERSLQRDSAEGRYGHAVPALLKQERYAEAARLEAWRAKPDRAAKLYERAGDMRGAASVYMSQGDFEMAALEDGGPLAQA